MYEFKSNSKIVLNQLIAEKYGCDENGYVESLGEFTVTGEYEVIEYIPADVSNYVWTPYVVFAKKNSGRYDPYYEVDADQLWRHIDPEGAKRYDIAELECEVHELEEWLKESPDNEEKIRGWLDIAKEKLDKLNDGE